ncbi:MAG TPA: ABC transporter substrate-binding protein [Candidatus Binatia bacterium]|jgi:ABC-type nitrate/sulfonate/bicarbonate transport system substrate-binding protein
MERLVITPWLFFLNALLSLLLLSSGASVEAQENKPEDVTVAYSNPGISTLPVNIAQENGFFSAEKLNVNLVLMQTFVAGRAVIGGNVDYNSLAGNMITLAAGGAPVKVVFVLVERPLFVFISRPEVKSAKDLKSKKVAVSTRGSIDDYFVRGVVAANGLNPDKDITSLSMGGTSNRLNALRTGAVDATGISVPYNLTLERAGYNRIAVAADSMHAVTNGLGVSDHKLKTQPEQIKRMIRAMLNAVAYIRLHRAEAVQRAKAFYKFDAPTAESAFDMLLQSLPVGGIPSDKAFETVINLSREQLGLRGDVPLSKVANLTLLREVVSELNR